MDGINNRDLRVIIEGTIRQIKYDTSEGRETDGEDGTDEVKRS